MTKTRKKTILIILWLCVIWGHSLMPATVSSGESDFFTDLMLKLIPALKNAENVDFLVRKAAHFTEFLILGCLLSAKLYELFNRFIKRFITVAGAGLFAAFIDETIQLFVEGRAGMIADMWIDFAGCMTGCIITLMIIKVRNNSNQIKL